MVGSAVPKMVWSSAASSIDTKSATITKVRRRLLTVGGIRGCGGPAVLLVEVRGSTVGHSSFLWISAIMSMVRSTNCSLSTTSMSFSIAERT